MKNFLFYLFLIVCFASCKNNSKTNEKDLAYEFVKVDSLVMDIMETVHVLDYHHEKDLYLIVKQASMEGHYFVVNKSGEILSENKLSEGPDAFGMVLARAGFVGDEILFVSEGEAFVYDLNLKQKRRFPFAQGVRARLVHFSLDNLSTFRSADGELSAVANLNDGYLQPYPMDYYDTLHLVHLMDIQSGEVKKGGKLDQNSKFRSGQFYPSMDKPVFFSDPRSNYISTILYGDTTLYQLDPSDGFKTVNKIKLDRAKPDQLIDIPMTDASYTTVKEYRTQNYVMGGAFDEIVGYGDEMLVGYRTGADPNLVFDNQNEEQQKAEAASKKRFFYYIKDGNQLGKPIPWTLPGRLKLNVGPRRYLQTGDQAELHDYEKDYQCYYIYELREME
ncbi:hypothetical protein [Algoriphagus sp. NG3]|uniref:hypothetical protein n=1 Tax=Algoriphagus sp. NG3 TaxID=3097546 RepID=UPI002A834F6E|nr:hypothetical protein [Algoriphagus sp. NG3]WPR74082.1 hypothetical protein SLW71_15530 [Algoriphagus sp. NG3]